MFLLSQTTLFLTTSDSKNPDLYNYSNFYLISLCFKRHDSLFELDLSLYDESFFSSLTVKYRKKEL